VTEAELRAIAEGVGLAVAGRVELIEQGVLELVEQATARILKLFDRLDHQLACREELTRFLHTETAPRVWHRGAAGATPNAGPSYPLSRRHRWAAALFAASGSRSGYLQP
jgi:hypothetical protein